MDALAVLVHWVSFGGYPSVGTLRWVSLNEYPCKRITTGILWYNVVHWYIGGQSEETSR